MVYLVIFTDALGGAEKRFVGMWQHLMRSGRRDVRLVVCDILREKLRSVAEFEGLEAFDEHMVIFRATSARRSLRATLFALWRRDRRAVFHYVHVPPVIVQAFPSRRTLFSMTSAAWRVISPNGLLAIGAGMIAAGHVDVLNEPIFRDVRRGLFWRTRSITCTPNSFVDLDFYRPAPYREKADCLTFVGVFTPNKGIFRLIESLPELDAGLRREGFKPEFRFLGREAWSPSAAEARAKLDPAIDVELYESSNPIEVLRRCKVFFSLQQTSNYPSKSLLEALACGALPVITDVVDSRRIARDEFSFYVPREFSAADLLRQSLRILRLAEGDFEAKVEAAREHLRRTCSVESMAAYFTDIYAQLAS